MCMEATFVKRTFDRIKNWKCLLAEFVVFCDVSGQKTTERDHNYVANEKAGWYGRHSNHINLPSFFILHTTSLSRPTCTYRLFETTTFTQMPYNCFSIFCDLKALLTFRMFDQQLISWWIYSSVSVLILPYTTPPLCTKGEQLVGN